MLQDKPRDATVDAGVLARQTPGFSGAELSNLVNEAALLAAKTSKTKLSAELLDSARDKAIMGVERKSAVTLFALCHALCCTPRSSFSAMLFACSMSLALCNNLHLVPCSSPSASPSAWSHALHFLVCFSPCVTSTGFVPYYCKSDGCCTASVILHVSMHQQLYRNQQLLYMVCVVAVHFGMYLTVLIPPCTACIL